MDLHRDNISVKAIVLTHKAAKELDALPRSARLIIARALHEYAIEGHGDVRKLRDRDGYRLRIGAYRILFAEDAQTILAVYVGRRSTNTYSGS